MRALDPRMAVPARSLHRTIVLACTTLILLTSSASAGTTVLQFSQVNPSDAITATVSGGVTTLNSTGYVDGGFVSIPVVLANFNGATEPPGTVVFETFTNVKSVGAAQTFGTAILQSYSGTIAFTSLPGGNGTDYLTATFSDATIFASMGAYAMTLSDSAPDLTFTSSFPILTSDTGMALSFSNVTPQAHLVTSNSILTLGAFTDQSSGTFSASVPEPSTFCLALVSVAIGAMAARVRKAREDQPRQ